MRTRYVAGSANRIVATTITVVAVVFIIAVSYVFYGDGGQENTSAQKLATKSDLDPEIVTKAYEQDSDGDGLADWEEVLWSTDPTKPDTDGNGVSDKDQVFAASESLSTATGLEDEMGVDTIETELKNQKNSDLPPTSTDALAKELFATYLYSLKSGTDLTQEQQEVMVQQALEKVTPLITAPTYKQSDVRSVPATSESRVRYIASIREIVLAMTTGSDNEDQAFLALAQGDKEWAVGVLSEMVHVYTIHIDKLRTMEVPVDAIGLHANFVQALMQYIFTIEGFSFINSDPLRTAASVNVFSTVRGRLVQTISMLRKYFELHQNTTSVLEHTN